MAQTLTYASKNPPAPTPRALHNGVLSQLWPAVALTLIIAILCGILYPLLVWGIAQLAFPQQANGSLVDKEGQATTDDSKAVGSALIGQRFGRPAYFHPRPSAANNSAGSSFTVGGGYDPTSSGATNYGPLSDTLLNGQNIAPAPATQPTTAPDAATSTAASAPSTAATAPATQPAAPTLGFDGLRLRTLHYARENGISFKLYTVHATHNADGTTTQVSTEVPLANYLGKDGNLNDVALVDAFPHAGDPDSKSPLIASAFSTPIPADAVTASGSGLDPHISPDNARLQIARVAKERRMGEAEVARYVSKYTDQPSLGILGEPGVNVLLLNLALDREHPVASATSAPATTATSPTSHP